MCIRDRSIGEPGTQLTMRTFHTGGVAGDDITQGLPRVEELFEARKPKGQSLISEVSGVVDIQEKTHPAGNPFEIPDMRNRGGQLNVTHPLPAHLGPGYLHPAAVTDNTAITNPFVLAAVTFPVFLGTEYFFAKESFTLRFKGAVINCFRLLHLCLLYTSRCV